ncbi:MAG: hypothetical protein DM484_26815 [Candidatus Methylumidiphilus alinenensis]|uniref:Lon proteolytic domain-containing protein n=1 Tax=Candidatus Methylumidiphilus alinenensis TaxID=2202197 RepID=A0A2W4QG58_9GAMM|nr:MAG: hypothetical protein DM484_26815 [Candidatus Methylumidiphilus alinenensis]
MAAKTLLIPVAALGETDKIGFLELTVEPASVPVDRHNPFQRLAQPGLEEAEAAARRAWSEVPPPLAVKVRVASPCFGLTNSTGAALGLALCPFLCAPAALSYQYAIVMGSLQFDGADGRIHIGAAGQLVAKLRAIRSRGYRRSPTLLIYASDGSDEAQREAAGLAALNIAVRRVGTFDEACRVCDGRPE